MSETKLYQIVGFQNHSREIPDNIAKDLFPAQGGLELILGIMPSGASYLLMREEDYFRRFRRTGKAPWLSTRFKSLSPILFESFADFKKKLSTYNPKKSKKGVIRDRSKANTQYTVQGGSEVESETGVRRANFEHQRVLYRLCQDTLEFLPQYAISPVPWLGNVRVISFAYNLWSSDTRIIFEREKDPMVLDVGWTEFALPMRGGQSGLTAISTTHLVVKENENLRMRDKAKQEFKHGETEILLREEVATRVQQLFEKTPVLIFFADTKWSKAVFSALGVPNTNWCYGIEPILRPRNSTTTPQSQLSGTQSIADSSGVRRPSRRERSQSPKREQRPYSLSRPRSPSRPSTTSSSTRLEELRDTVLYVDVREMYTEMKKVATDRSRDFVINYAIDLGVREVILDGSLPVGRQSEVWCAGNESRLIGYMWNSMASGNAIDDQRIARWGPLSKEAAEGHDNPLELDSDDTKEGVAEDGDTDSDSDVDPNDLYPDAPQQSYPAGSSSGFGSGGPEKFKDPYEALEDDDW